MQHLLEIPAVTSTGPLFYSAMYGIMSRLTELKDFLVELAEDDIGKGNGAARNELAAIQDPKQRRLYLLGKSAQYFSMDDLRTAVANISPSQIVSQLQQMQQAQAPDLEAILLEATIKEGMPRWMNVKSGNARVKYSMEVEGRCLECYRKGDPKKGLRPKNTDIAVATLDEFQRNWKEMLVLDGMINDDEKVRDKYSPLCDGLNGQYHNGHKPTLLTASVHSFVRANTDGTVAVPFEGYDARTKSGTEAAFKVAEWLIGEKANFGDYLASRSICERPELPGNFVRFLEAHDNTDWEGLLLAQNCQGIIPKIYSDLAGQNGLRGIYKAKIQPHIEIERVALYDADGKKVEPRFIEARLPDHDTGNEINHHVYAKKWFDQIRGTDFNHFNYAAIRLDRRLQTWTPLHWLVFQRIGVPVYEASYSLDFSVGISAQRLKAGEEVSPKT